MKNNPQVARLSATAQAQIGMDQNSPKKAVMASTTLIAQQISGLTMARQWTIAHLLHQANELVNNTLGRHGETAGLQEDYEAYFLSKLGEFGVKSPAELDEEKKSEFFNAVSDGWKNGVGPKETAAVKEGYFRMQNPKFSGPKDWKAYDDLGKKYGFDWDGWDEDGNACWHYEPSNKQIGQFKKELTKLEGKKPNFSEEASFTETADSYVKATQGGNTFRLKASSSGNISEALIWKDGAWVKPASGEEFKEKEDHRMWGALKTANGCALATLTVNEGDDPQAVLAELRHLYGTGTEWNDNSVYDGAVPSVSVTPYSSMAYTQSRNPLARLELEDRLRVNGVDCEVKGYQDDCIVVVPEGGSALALPLDRLVVTSGNEATLMKSAFTSDVVLSSVGFDNLRDYSCLREEVTAATASHGQLATLGATLGGMVKAGNRRGLQLAMAGLKRVNEGYELIQAGVNCDAKTGEVATAAVLTEEAEVEQEEATFTGKRGSPAAKAKLREQDETARRYGKSGKKAKR